MRRGVTLVELLVVLLILGLVTAVSAPALASLRPAEGSAWIRAVHRARSEAAASGRPARVRLGAGAEDSLAPVLVLPDGRAVGPGVDPLTGEPHATR